MVLSFPSSLVSLTYAFQGDNRSEVEVEVVEMVSSGEVMVYGKPIPFFVVLAY